jgi:hypothetical protein
MGAALVMGLADDTTGATGSDGVATGSLATASVVSPSSLVAFAADFFTAAFLAGAFFATAFLAAAFFAGVASPSSVFFAAAFFAAFLTGLASCGCVSRIKPSRLARERTRSACWSMMVDDWVFTPMPILPHKSSVS